MKLSNIYNQGYRLKLVSNKANCSVVPGGAGNDPLPPKKTIKSLCMGFRGDEPEYLVSISEIIQVLPLELVSKELNHLAAILHVCAGGLNFMK